MNVLFQLNIHVIGSELCVSPKYVKIMLSECFHV